MNPSGKTEIRESSIWESIKTGKEVLEFIGEIPEWTNYNENLEGYLEIIATRKKRLCCIEQDLTEEVANIEFQTNRKRKREVDNWLRNAKAKADDVDKMEDEMKRKSFVSKFLFRPWLTKCVKTELEDVNELIKGREALGAGKGLVLEASNGIVQHRLVTSALIGKASLDKKLDIWTKLSNPRVRTLGVSGEQGMGKTTIMANIYNQEVANNGLFERAFYVYVREDVNLYRLQASIGEAMNLDNLVHIQDVSRRAARLQIALKSCGKFLLILDGLLEYFRVIDVGIPMEENGGKLVVVSRSQSVCRKACEELITVEKLSEDDSEELFMKTIRTSNGPEISSEIALEIIGKCGGVPSKIVDTAVLLRGIDGICEWRDKLRELSSRQEHENECFTD